MLAARRLFGTETRLGWIPAAIAVALAAGTGTIVLAPAAAFLDGLITDDGFYSLTVARNLARGHGLTIDGTTLTNGIQPLFVLLTVPIFAVAGDDRLLALRGVTALNWIIFVAAAATFGRVLSQAVPDRGALRRLVFFAGTAVYLANNLLLLLHLGGLETGLVLLGYCGVGWYLQSHRLDRLGEWLSLGGLLGLLVLARIDAVFFVGLVCVYLVVSRGRPVAFRAALVVGATALLVSLPWWLFNIVAFDHPIPSSGLAQQRWELSLERLETMLRELKRPLLPLSLLPGTVPLPGIRAVRTAIAFTAAVAAIVCFLPLARITLARHSEKSAADRTISGLVLLAGSVGCLAIWYAVSSFASWHLVRYFAPMMIVTLAVVAVLLVAWWTRMPRAAAIVLSGLAVTVPVQIVLIHRPPATARAIGATTYPGPSYRDQLALVDQFVPPADRVSAGQSGTLGYFRDRVVNLDGKVNPGVLPYRMARPNRVSEYMAQQDLRWICDWPGEVARYLGHTPHQRGWVKVAEAGAFVLYRRDAAPDSPAR